MQVTIIMKKLYRYIGCMLLAAAIPFSSCQNFDEINTNPDATTQVTPSLLASGLLLNIMSQGGNKYFVYDDMLCKLMAWGGEMEDNQYNIIGRSSFGYTTLTNTVKMVETAQSKGNNVEAYDALAHFIKAWKIYYMSMEMGDVPYEEALQGETGLVQPKYNTQKEVMAFVLQDLDKAYELFSVAKDFDGDSFLGGSVKVWKKVTRAFELKVLMSLSKKADDADLNIKNKFAQIVAEGDLMSSNDDNLQIKYADKANTVYPFNTVNTKHSGYAMISTTLTDAFKQTGDFRLFYYANPAKSKLNEGLDESDWNAYIGTDPSLPFTQVSDAFTNGQFSGLNTRYTDYAPGEPVIRVGYAEQNFILAEAAVRGWINEDASTYYKKAIKAHLDFLSTFTPDEKKYHHGHPITDEYIASFLDTPAIQLTGNTENDLKQILTQKYLTSYMQYTYDVYYDYRRTGLPELPINPETNRNTVKDKLPMRWMYPKSESDYNGDNLNEALQRQFGGSDDVNALMWILK